MSPLHSPERIARLHLPGRGAGSEPSIVAVEDRLSAFASKHSIEHDLTSASTSAFPPPPYFLDGVVAAVRDGRPGYTSLRGDHGVREALAPSLSRLLGTEVDPAEVVLTAGTQGGLFATLAALVDDGDRVLIADPEYLCTERVAQFLGARVIHVPFTRLGRDGALDLDVVERGLREGARVVAFSNPHNPTGTVIGADALAELAELVIAADAWVLADELYARFVYDDGPVPHMAAIPGMRERCVTALGPSKTESASGFRIGVLVGPTGLLDEVTRVVEITTVRAPAYAQYALEPWLRDDDAFVRERVDVYRRLRDVTVERLSRVEGVAVSSPAATAWLFPDLSGLGRSEEEIVQALIEAGILVMPGTSFGPAGGGHVRLCFGQHEATWPSVIDRVADVLDGLRR